MHQVHYPYPYCEKRSVKIWLMKTDEIDSKILVNIEGYINAKLTDDDIEFMYDTLAPESIPKYKITYAGVITWITEDELALLFLRL